MLPFLPHLSTELLAAQCTVCGPSWAGNGKPITDAFARLYLVVAGEGFVEHHGVRHHLCPGRVHVIPAFSPGIYVCPRRMELLWCHFRARLFASLDLFAFFGSAHDVEIPTGERAGVCRAFRRLVCGWQAATPAGILEADGILRQILSLFAGSFEESASRTRLQALARFQPVFAHVDRNLHRPLVLAELAGLVHLHPTYFSNLFARECGESPVRYVTRRRIQRAQALLLESRVSIKEIATDTGFRDVYYFSRVFRAATGISPGAFRRQTGAVVP